MSPHSEIFEKVNKVISIVIEDIRTIIGLIDKDTFLAAPKLPASLSKENKFELDVYLCTLTASLIGTSLESPFALSKDEMIDKINSALRIKGIGDYQLTKVVNNEANNA